MCCTHSCGAACLQGHGGKACPTRRSSRTTRSRPDSAGSTWSAIPTTNTSPGPRGLASWRAAGWGWASTRPWWRAAGRSREWPTHTGAAAHSLAFAATLSYIQSLEERMRDHRGTFLPRSLMWVLSLSCKISHTLSHCHILWHILYTLPWFKVTVLLHPFTLSRIDFTFAQSHWSHSHTVILSLFFILLHTFSLLRKSSTLLCTLWYGLRHTWTHSTLCAHLASFAHLRTVANSLTCILRAQSQSCVCTPSTPFVHSLAHLRITLSLVCTLVHCGTHSLMHTLCSQSCVVCHIRTPSCCFLHCLTL